MKEQKLLFEIIKSKIPGNCRLADVIEEVLNVSTHSAYRRIRGDQELSFSELKKICEHFNLSMDEILNNRSSKGVLFHNTPIDPLDKGVYFDFLKRRTNRWEMLKSASDVEFVCTAHDIPFYHAYQYPELIFFRLFATKCIMYNLSMSYDSFCNDLEKEKIASIFLQIRNNTLLIPSSEIWCEQTIDSILKLLAYHYETGAFKTKDTARLLLSQLANLLDSVQQYAIDGFKDAERKIPFSMYVCSTSIENNILLAKYRNNFFCSVKLYLNNSIETYNSTHGYETKRWIDDMISKSTLISGGTSAKERLRFFGSSKTRIQQLMDKI
jgi:hypothetical protein